MGKHKKIQAPPLPPAPPCVFLCLPMIFLYFLMIFFEAPPR